jgi:glycosyltransferase involved in cell wall biosynthesis
MIEKKKVLVLASTFPRWQGDTTPPFVYELERRLANDFDITVLAPHYKGAKKNENMDNLNVVRFQYFWPERWQKLAYNGGIMPNIKKNKLLILLIPFFLLSELIKAIHIIKKNKINIIHAHWIIPQGIIAFLLQRLLKIPYILTIHGTDIFSLKNKFVLTLKKNIVTNASSVTVVSTAIKKEVEKLVGTKVPIVVAPMGVDENKFNPEKYSEEIKQKFNISGPFLLFVGRLEEVKGIEYLIEAMRGIVRYNNKSKLLIVGEGPIKEKLISLCNSLNLNDSITFVGALPHSDLPAYFATADYFISPSVITDKGQVEGFGLTLVEASLSGCIPIATKTGGIIDIIEHRETGFFVDNKSHSSITDTVLNLMQNKALHHSAKEKGREINLNKFTWNSSVYKFNSVYNNSL